MQLLIVSMVIPQKDWLSVLLLLNSAISLVQYIKNWRAIVQHDLY